MGRKGLLFDLDYCTGCFACCVACKQENQYEAGFWGIKVTEFVIEHPNGHIQVDYLPYPTTLCTMCESRIESGEDTKPTCVKHCQAQCIEYGEVSELAKRYEQKNRFVLFAPK